MDKYYVALFLEVPVKDGMNVYCEPSENTGYKRVEISSVDEAVRCLSGDYPIEFTNLSGYGWITHYAVMDAQTGGNMISKISLKKIVYVDNDAIPILHKGKLLLGVDMSAKITSWAQTQFAI